MKSVAAAASWRICRSCARRCTIRSRVLPIGGALVASRSGTQTALSCSRKRQLVGALGQGLRGESRTRTNKAWVPGSDGLLAWVRGGANSPAIVVVVVEEEHPAGKESARVCMPDAEVEMYSDFASPYPAHTARCRRALQVESRERTSENFNSSTLDITSPDWALQWGRTGLAQGMAQRLPLRSAALCLAGVAVAFALFHHSADSDSSARASSSPLSALLSLGVKLVLTSVLVLLAQLALALWIERPRLSRDRGPDRARRGPCGGPTSLPARSRVAAVRPLYFTSPAAWSVTQTRARWEAAAAAKGEEASSSSSSSEASAPRFLDAALDSVLKLVVRDFVLKWYSPLSDSPTFPNAVETIIRDALVAVSVRVARVDWSEILVGRILPLLTLHLEQCHVAEQAVHGKRRDDAGSSSAPLPPPDSDEADLFLAARFAQETQSKRLHPAVDTASTNSRPAEDAWLRQVVESILPHILPEHEYESEAVRIMVREIVACAVMIPILETLCDPDFWNRLIDDKVRALSFTVAPLFCSCPTYVVQLHLARAL